MISDLSWVISNDKGIDSFWRSVSGAGRGNCDGVRRAAGVASFGIHTRLDDTAEEATEASEPWRGKKAEGGSLCLFFLLKLPHTPTEKWPRTQCSRYSVLVYIYESAGGFNDCFWPVA